MRYALWNNKGGVGKTFLTFLVATRVAELLRLSDDPRQVFVLDMCPQANISEILLGGNGSGDRIVSELKSNRKTVSFYLDDRISNRTGNDTSYFLNVSQFNDRIPDNLHLIPGDSDLETRAEVLNFLIQSPRKDSWKITHNWISDLVASIESNHSGAIIFIDCNPSFSIYTRLALIAANRLIVPCTPDGSSVRAIKNLGKLIYGCDVDKDLNEEYEGIYFWERAEESKINIPKLHLFISNRLTLYKSDKSPVARAFEEAIDLLGETVLQLMQRNELIFSQRDMRRLFHRSMPDNHSIGVAMTRAGIPLNSLKRSDSKLVNATIDQKLKDNYASYLDSIVAKLDLSLNLDTRKQTARKSKG